MKITSGKIKINLREMYLISKSHKSAYNYFPKNFKDGIHNCVFIIISIPLLNSNFNKRE